MLCHKQQQERNNVFKLNENRPGKKIWNMIRKINGNAKSPLMLSILISKTLVTINNQFATLTAVDVSKPKQPVIVDPAFCGWLCPLTLHDNR